MCLSWLCMRNESDGGRPGVTTGESNERKISPSAAPIHVPREIQADRAAFLSRIDASPSPLARVLTEADRAQLDRYVALLYEQSASLSLISKSDRPEIYTRHILDSLAAARVFDVAPGCGLDIGSGGGLPGIPLAIVWPETRVVLLEARNRKAAFLEKAVRSLGMRSVRVACERLEEHARKGEPIYDALFIRAVAEPYRLIDEIAPRCLPGARWVYFAGTGVDRADLIDQFARTGRSAAESAGSAEGRILHGLV